MSSFADPGFSSVCVWGGGGGGRGAEKRFEFTLYLVSLNLLNKGGPMVIANSRFQGAKVQHFPGGGGGSNFFHGKGPIPISYRNLYRL